MKLRRKLLSAGLALGATALTLTTSTFAWYTSNSDVQASGISAESGANGDSLLMISTTSSPSDFSNSVSWGLSASNLQPVQYTVGSGTAAGTFKPVFKQLANGTINSTAVTVSTGEDSLVYQVDLYFKSSTESHVYLKSLSVTNETGKSAATDPVVLPTKDVLSTAGTSFTADQVTAGQTYTVDLLRALKIAYCTEKVATTTGATPTTSTTYAVGSAYTFGANDETPFGCTYTSDSVSGSKMTNAHTYYTAVTGNELTGNAPVTTKLALNTDFGITPAGLAKGNYLLVHFYFFIDGWDTDCFDAVQGQNFSVNFTFSSKESV